MGSTLFPPKQIEKMIKMAENGMSPREIAKHFNTSPDNIKRWLRQNKVDWRKKEELPIKLKIKFGLPDRPVKTYREYLREAEERKNKKDDKL